MEAAGFDDNTCAIIKRFHEFYEDFPEATEIKAGVFLTWYFSTKKTNCTTEQKDNWQKIMDRVDKDLDPSVAETIHDRLLEAGLAHKSANALQRYQAGDDINITRELSGYVEEFEKQKQRKLATSWVGEDAVVELLDATKDDTGIHFRLGVLDRNLRPMRAGDFIGVAARPDAGKTSFLASEATFWAPQIEAVWKRKAPILYLNNEGDGSRVKLRMLQAALGLSLSGVAALREKVGIVGVWAKYYEAVGGKDSIIIKDIHGMWSHDVEDIITELQPAIVIADMIDKIKFSGGTLQGGTRTDEKLEAQYDWFRDLGVVQHFIGVATSQISADGSGLLYPELHMLKDSKTGKQGSYETLIMIGKSADPVMENVRGISTPKNKLRREGVSGNKQELVDFNAAACRFMDAS